MYLELHTGNVYPYEVIPQCDDKRMGLTSVSTSTGTGAVMATGSAVSRLGTNGHRDPCLLKWYLPGGHHDGLVTL